MAVETAMMAGNNDGVGGDRQGSVSKITLARQWAGGGTGSDTADGGIAIAVRGCTDRMGAKGGGGESAASESMVGEQ